MKDIANFIFEAGMLKRVSRGAWQFLMSYPESVADHSHRAAIIGWILADMEKADKDKVIKMMLFHDMEEARIGDITKYPGKAYIDTTPAGKNIVSDQKSRLPVSLATEYESIISEYIEGKTAEAVIAKDADTLDFLASLIERRLDRRDEISITQMRLRTQSAKRLSESILSTDPGEWWMNAPKN